MITVNFNQIADKGMAVDFIKEHEIESYGFIKNSINSVDIFDILNTILKTNTVCHAIISKNDINQQLKKVFSQNNQVEITGESGLNIEYTLGKIFGDALGVRKINLHDNFFTLGGNSLIAIRCINKVNEAFGLNLPISLIFDCTTFSELCKKINTFTQEKPNEESWVV